MNKNLPHHPDRISVRTIDLHTGGEPLRVILDGYPEIKGNTVLERRSYVQNYLDHLRKSLMWEPRGHADMYGCIPVPPNDDGADLGVIFMHNAGYSTMCGHATIALGRLAKTLGWIENDALVLDAPCGRLFVTIEQDQVSFIGVPSFVLHQNQNVSLANGESFQYDIAYGGAFYAYVQVSESRLPLVPENYENIKQLGGALKKAIMEQGPSITHPFTSDLSFLYGVIFIGGPISDGVDSRNVCVFADKEVDRCPTGSGVMGRLALSHLNKALKIQENIEIESITGSVFKGSIVNINRYGEYEAVIPKVTGSAHITGEHLFHIDPDDPFREGFILK